MHEEKSNFSITRMVRLLDVSRSGYYAWTKRGPSRRALRQERIAQKVAWFHGDFDEVPGSPKILVELREDVETISRKTVAKVMRGLGLKGVCPKRWRTTTITKTADTYPETWCNASGTPGPLIRYGWAIFPTCAPGKEQPYLATVIDAHSRRVIGWAIDEHMRSDLVEDAPSMTITVRGERPEKLIFH
jgi:transposase InsO family protein